MRITVGTEQFLYQIVTAYGWSERTGVYAAASAVNSLAAASGEQMELEAQVALPIGAEKSWIRRTEKQLREACACQGIRYAGSTSGWSPAGNVPAVSVAAVAHVPKEEPWCPELCRAGQDIVLSGWIGMEGMLRIVEEREEELKKRFAPVFLRQISDYGEKIFARKELDVAKAMGVSAVRQVTEGGILAALWNLAKAAGAGLEVDMRKLSVLQETIEVCEYYRLNPYQLTSAGAFLMVTDDGEALADALKREQVKVSVIGRITDGNDKILRNGEEVRYIDRPVPDEVLKAV